MAIALYYDDAQNPDGNHFPGVPLDDLTEEMLTAQPEYLQRSIAASKFYRKTKPPERVEKEKKEKAAKKGTTAATRERGPGGKFLSKKGTPASDAAPDTQTPQTDGDNGQGESQGDGDTN